MAQPSAAPTLTAMAPLSKSTVSGGTASRKILSYTYVFRDLRRISILAGTAFAILIVLAIILR